MTDAKELKLKGTLSSSFTIGENGATIHQGTSIPDSSVGKNGDMFIYVDNSQISNSIYLRIGNVWNNISNNPYSMPSPNNNEFVVGNGSNFVTKDVNQVKNLLGIGTSGSASYDNITVGTLLAGTNYSPQLFPDLVSGTISIGSGTPNINLNGSVQVLGTSLKPFLTSSLPSSVIYVSTSGNDNNDGSLLSPYKTITKAITVAADGDQIKISQGSYVEDITINKEIMLYADQGAANSYPTKIIGKAVLTGTKHIRATNIEFRNNGTGTSDVALHVKQVGLEAGFKFQNCCFMRNRVDSEKDVILLDDSDGVWDGSVLFENAAYVMGKVRHNAAGYSRFSNCQQVSYCDFITQNANSILAISGAWTIRRLTHIAGVLIAENVHQFLADPLNSNISVTSTANTMTDALYLVNCNFVQDDGSTFALINKTGGCPYTIVNTIRNISSDVTNGYRLDYARPSGIDLSGGYNAINYNGSRLTSISDHLAGIDDTLGKIFSGQTTDNTSTEIFLNGSANQRLVIGSNSCVNFEISVIGATANYSKVYTNNYVGSIIRNGSGVQILGSGISSINNSTNCAASSSITADIANNSLKISVTGETGETFSWKAKVKINKL